MHPHSQKQEEYDESSPPECNDLDYLEISAGQPGYSQENNTQSLPLDQPQVAQPSSLVNIFSQPSISNTASTYSGDGPSYYPPHSTHVFGGIDVRSRLNQGSTSSSTAGTGMAHTHPHRPTTLPHPTHNISAREQYASSMPSFRRQTEHPTRSPPFTAPGIRRHQISPAPSTLPAFGPPLGRMDSGHFASHRPSQSNTPPLAPVEVLGVLQYADSSGISVDITGSIDKGFFQSEGDWTCYRRNYFACICSFSLDPYFSPAAPIQFISNDSGRPSQPMQIYRFAMCISAVVADSDQHEIELIQHTPKRDKGPTGKPEKVVLAPKQATGGAHQLNVYGEASGMHGGRSTLFPESLISPQAGGQSMASEHTFERIQFKQATQNNGKRRAAQQYYHLVLELYADVGNQSTEQFIKVAQRKSAKMIVRGRSPGHYQTDRRGSHSSGPGGSTGPMSSYPGLGGMGDFGGGGPMMGGGHSYGGGYDARATMFGVRHHEIPAEATIPPEDEKALQGARGYQYFPSPLYGAQPDRISMYPNRNESSHGSVPHMSSSMDMSSDRVGSEGDMAVDLPRFYNPPLMSDKRRCREFEGRSSSNGYYPVMSEPSGMNITMTG